MRFLFAVGLMTLGLPLGALALPEVPNFGESGLEIELPEAFFDHYPPEEPTVPHVLDEIPPAASGSPAGGVVPPSPVTPAGKDMHPLGGAPPFDLGPGAVGPPSFVPEPGVVWMLALGIVGLAYSGRARP